MDGLRIDRLPHGGFVVSEVPAGPNVMARCLFGASHIDDALGYIKDKLEAGGKPVNAEAPARCAHCGSAGMQDYCSRGACPMKPGNPNVQGPNLDPVELARARGIFDGVR
jgi:hypothetical protein